VTAVSLHPGVVATEIWRQREEASGLMSFVYTLSRPLVRAFATTASNGAKATNFCSEHLGATHPDVPSKSGILSLNFVIFCSIFKFDNYPKRLFFTEVIVK